MKDFLADDFMLDTPTAVEIYNEIKDLPIIDYHCHLSATEIDYKGNNRKTITELWLDNDHYKWRAMRNMGVAEEYITKTPHERYANNTHKDYDRFVAYATIMPYMAGHPLYAFTAMELKKYFGITKPLNKDTADEIYEKANAVAKELTPKKIIADSNVETIITTNDPAEDLRAHIDLRQEGYEVNVLPGFRPDQALGIEKEPFAKYLALLGMMADHPIKTFDDLKIALSNRLDLFTMLGCVASDHGLDTAVYCPIGEAEADNALQKALAGKSLTRRETDGYKTELLLFLAREYHARNIVMELHFGCLRNANSHLLEFIGKDAGFDCMRSYTGVDALYALLDRLNSDGILPKTILFSLNPQDNDVLVTLMGAFNNAGVKGYVQQGCAWWFNDNKIGIERQIATYASGAPIDTFLGMLTDSRSFLSYPRHDYFRRILSNYLGGLVEHGEYPASELNRLKQIARDIAYYNVKKYFNLD